MGTNSRELDAGTRSHLRFSHLRRDEDELPGRLLLCESHDLFNGDVPALGVHEDVELIHHPAMLMVRQHHHQRAKATEISPKI